MPATRFVAYARSLWHRHRRSQALEISSLDVRTLSFIAAIGGALMAVTMGGLHLAGAQHGRALGFWGGAGIVWAVAYFVGFMIPALAEQIPPSTVATIANLMIGTGFVLVLFGIQAYRKQKISFMAMGAIALVLVVVTLALPEVRESVRLRQIVYSSWFIFIIASATWLMGWRPSGGLKPYERAVAAILGIYGFFLTLRLGFLFILDQPLESFASNSLQVGVFVVATMVSFSLSVALAVLLLRNKELDLKYLARHCPLTRLRNRHSMEDLAPEEVARAERYEYPLSVIMIDLDRFKRINDQFGHHGGDLALKHCADLIRDNLRDADIPFRLGGEEFVVLLSNTDARSAVNLAERLRRKLECTPVELDGDSKHCVTASFGVVEYRAGDKSWNTMIREADDAMYLAKKKGRNRVEVSGEGVFG